MNFSTDLPIKKRPAVLQLAWLVWLTIRRLIRSSRRLIGGWRVRLSDQTIENHTCDVRRVLVDDRSIDALEHGLTVGRIDRFAVKANDNADTVFLRELGDLVDDFVVDAVVDLGSEASWPVPAIAVRSPGLRSSWHPWPVESLGAL